ncbi:MAG: hypothetical protein KC777_28625 [Cyanobacteria bacterium HKST-UBA02]|nr:hypothetical protein [Cyanobacteria bacterium HKST-UBA02]
MSEDFLEAAENQANAPDRVRAAVLYAARDCYIPDQSLYMLACEETKTLFDASQEHLGDGEFGPPPYFERVTDIFRKAPWYNVFDIIEAIWKQMQDLKISSCGDERDRFREEVNRAFRRSKKGWLLDENGKVISLD